MLACSPCPTTPPMRFVYLGSRFTLRASFPRSVTLTQLRFTCLAVASSAGDLHPEDRAHAGRTSKTPTWKWALLSVESPNGRPRNQTNRGRFPDVIRLSRRTYAVLWQNIGLALGIKAVFFVLAVFGSATMWMAVFADMGASLLVVFNGLRLLGVVRRR
jgi:hypothetical protein